MKAEIKQKSNTLQVNIRLPEYKYLNNVIGQNCFEEIHWLLKTYGKSASPAKEITESYSAIYHLRKTFKRIESEGKKPLVIHVGDGSRFISGAMTSLMTRSYNLSIDPNLRTDYYHQWVEKFKIRDFRVIPSIWQEANIKLYLDEVEQECGYQPEIIVTCVHGHVDLKKFLNSLPRWSICYSLACCQKSIQIPDMFEVIDHGEDMNVLSPEREYKIYQRLSNSERQKLFVDCP